MAAERLADLGPKILAVDQESDSLLMEFVPGQSLSDFGLDDAVTIPIYARLALGMRHLDPTGLPNLAMYYRTQTELIDKLMLPSRRLPPPQYFGPRTELDGN